MWRGWAKAHDDSLSFGASKRGFKVFLCLKEVRLPVKRVDLGLLTGLVEVALCLARVTVSR